MKKRIHFFIDGFNLYYSLVQNTKWLDLAKLCQSRVNENEITRVFYFSAHSLNPKNKEAEKEKRARHNKYMDCLKSRNVSIILGFHAKKINKLGVTVEEKCTDVNLALQVFIEVYKKSCDKVVIVSADTDFSTIPKMLFENFSDMELAYIFPSNQSKRIKDYINYYKKLGKKYEILPSFTAEEYQNSQFPNEVNFNKKIITKPAKYE